jgi:hypothetical protein
VQHNRQEPLGRPGFALGRPQAVKVASFLKELAARHDCTIWEVEEMFDWAFHDGERRID